MFNVKVLNDAIMQLSDEGRAEIQKMVNIFEEYKNEVGRLTEVADGFEQLAINLQKEKELLVAKLAEFTSQNTETIKPKEEFVTSHELQE